MIEIYLGGHLNFYQPDKRTRLQIPLEQPQELLSLLEQAGVPIAEVAFATLNGELVELPETTVSPGDRVELYPPMGGG